MTKSEEIVQLLIRKAFDKDYCVNPKDFQNVNWGDVIDLSSRQGVGAIAFDGIEFIPASCLPGMEPLMEWLGRTSYQETLYEHNWQVANHLAELWGEKGITATVLKGRAIAQYYPKPEHRYSCDLDVFIPDEETDSQWEEACTIVKQKGVKIVNEVYKEAEFTLNGLYVECHRYITPLRGNDTLLRFEKHLRYILDSEERYFFEGSKLASPPLMFTVMLFIEHALGDYLHGQLSLKHVVDWIVLRKQAIDWSTFDTSCREYKFDRFVSLINALADVVEGKTDQPSLPRHYQEAFNEMFTQSPKRQDKQSWFQRRVGLFFVYVKNKKRFDKFGYCSMRRLLFKSMWAHFFDKKVKL